MNLKKDTYAAMFQQMPVVVEPGVVGLDRLGLGRTAAIVRMDEADHALMIRLKTMGMHEGRAVRMLRTGSRIMVQCAGTRMGLSAEVARHVMVKPLT